LLYDITSEKNTSASSWLLFNLLNLVTPPSTLSLSGLYLFKWIIRSTKVKLPCYY
jgi:hypothetical protein